MNDQTRALTALQRAALMRRSRTRVVLGVLGLVLGGLVGMLVQMRSALSLVGLFTIMSVFWMGVCVWEPRLNAGAMLWTGVQGWADGRAGRTQTQTITLRTIRRVAWDDVLVADDGTRYPLAASIRPSPPGTRLTITVSPRSRLVWAVTPEGETR